MVWIDAQAPDPRPPRLRRLSREGTVASPAGRRSSPRLAPVRARRLAFHASVSREVRQRVDASRAHQAPPHRAPLRKARPCRRPPVRPPSPPPGRPCVAGRSRPARPSPPPGPFQRRRLPPPSRKGTVKSREAKAHAAVKDAKPASAAASSRAPQRSPQPDLAGIRRTHALRGRRQAPPAALPRGRVRARRPSAPATRRRRACS